MPDKEKNETPAVVAEDKTTDGVSAENAKGDNRGWKKRQNQGKKENDNKRSKQERRKNHTWREEKDGNETEEGYVRNFGSSKNKVHGGSYANPAQRELFGVTLPPHLIPSTHEEKKEEWTGDGNRKFVKRKVAFLLGYLGTGYSGFQSNEGQKTLQGEFELAMLKTELLSPLNMGFFHKYGWSTSGRTDKGVHAAAQVCSAKIQLRPDQSLDDVRSLLNQNLPEHFRVLDVNKTTKKFCAKTGRSRVRYQYMIPAFCFWDRKELKELMNKLAPLDNEVRTPGRPLSEDECNEIKQLVKNYRVEPEQLEALKTALHKYEGTHSFHNFTNKLSAQDASATRYIVSFNVEDPMIFDNGMQWIPTQVLGQSFLIHQIRKMVSVAIDSVRLGLPDLIPDSLDKKNSNRTDLAPAQGLFMEMSFYDSYNGRLQSQQSDVHPLEWHSNKTEVFHRWKKFRNEVIMDHIVKEEEREDNFLQHIYNHEFYFDVDEYYGL